MNHREPFNSQLLKWIGSKQRQAVAIIAMLPERFSTYFEPFLGSGGVLGVLSPGASGRQRRPSTAD